MPADSPVADRRLNLNTASVQELESLPGIGPTLARRIVEYRTTHGSFRRVDDLNRIRGIGDRTLASLRPLVHVEP